MVALTQLNQLVPCLGSVLAGGFLAGTANRAAHAYGAAPQRRSLTPGTPWFSQLTPRLLLSTLETIKV